MESDRPLITEKEINNEIRRLMHMEWEREWQQWIPCKQTRLFYPTLRPEKAWEMVNSVRPIYSLLVQFETGHNFMRRHQHVIDSANGIQGTSATCRLCDTGEETSCHIISQCTELCDIRMKYFNRKYLNPPYLNLDKSALLGFLREVPIEELQFFLPEGEHLHQ